MRRVTGRLEQNPVNHRSIDTLNDLGHEIESEAGVGVQSCRERVEILSSAP